MSVASSTLTRPRRGRLYILIGAVLAVLAFGAAALIASLPLIQGSSGGVRVVVAAHDIKARTVIQAADLTLGSFSPAQPQAFFAVKDVGRVSARVDIPSGAAVTTNLVAPAGDILASSDTTYLPIPKGWIAITIPTSEQEGVGGYVQNGDRINVVATINTSIFGQSPGRNVVLTVFTDVPVLRAGPAGSESNTQSTTGVVTSSLTILLTSCDAEFMTWLLSNSQLKYELESSSEYSALPTQPYGKCPNVQSAKGVGPKDVDLRWSFTTH